MSRKTFSTFIGCGKPLILQFIIIHAFCMLFVWLTVRSIQIKYRTFRVCLNEMENVTSLTQRIIQLQILKWAKHCKMHSE